jgi:DNA (cytosine-5)-methyltransferase 1
MPIGSKQQIARNLPSVPVRVPEDGHKAFPVIDLFAGPGGLGEGFASYINKIGLHSFKVALSVEKDAFAYKTLELRKFFRQFPQGEVPEEYYQYLSGKISRELLFEKFEDQANRAQEGIWKAELGKTEVRLVDNKIRNAIGKNEFWVLVGGPPCQAYSTIGRSKIRNLGPETFEQDSRHFLYREYLRILRRFSPPVFVMENVKGLLSSKIDGELIIGRILKDLSRKAGSSPGYNIYSFVQPSTHSKLDPSDFLICSEKYGIPQNRHRVLLLGIRRDLPQRHLLLEPAGYSPTVNDAIGDLPKLRSKLSREPDSSEMWHEAISAALDSELLGLHFDGAVGEVIRRTLESGARHDTGHDGFVEGRCRSEPSKWFSANHAWFEDIRLEGVCNHSSRAHMRSDLARYLFISAYGKVHGTSPKLRHFPTNLLPAHENVAKAMTTNMFCDRFRVQVGEKPSTTVLSHIAKDGHYYIHPDPSQCRSLTVREAARLQTFPDNYYFEGPKTEQYRQVGNAVPPLLGRQLAHVVNDILATSADMDEHQRSEFRQLNSDAEPVTPFPSQVVEGDAHSLTEPIEISWEAL